MLYCETRPFFGLKNKHPKTSKTRNHQLGISKNREKTPKMDGENHGKPYFLMDDLGGKPTIIGNSHMKDLQILFKYLYHYICQNLQRGAKWFLKGVSLFKGVPIQPSTVPPFHPGTCIWIYSGPAMDSQMPHLEGSTSSGRVAKRYRNGNRCFSHVKYRAGPLENLIPRSMAGTIYLCYIHDFCC